MRVCVCVCVCACVCVDTCTTHACMPNMLSSDHTFHFPYQSENTASKLDEIRASLLHRMSTLCGCELSPANFVGNQELSCWSGLQGVAMGGATAGVVYRSGLVGTDTTSADGLVQLLQSWVRGGRAALTVGGLLLGADPNCTTQLGGLSDADCTGQTQGTQEMGVVTAPPTALTSDVVVVVAAVGGVVVVLQLVILVAAVMVCACRRWRRKSIRFVLMQRVGEGGGGGGAQGWWEVKMEGVLYCILRASQRRVWVYCCCALQGM